MNIFVLPIAASVIALLYGIWWPGRNPSITRSLFKTTPILILAAFSLVSGNPILLTVAFLLSALGDAFLSRDGEKMFLMGLGSFLLAHIAFTFVFFATSPMTEMMGSIEIWVLIGILLLMTLVLINLWGHLGVMKVPVILYAIAIGSMALAAWYSQMGLVLYIGVGLFVFSDIVLAHELFYWKNNTIRNIANYVVWFTYYCAQLIIAMTFYMHITGQ